MKKKFLLISLAFLAGCNNDKQTQGEKQKKDTTGIIRVQPTDSLDNMSKLNFVDKKLQQDLEKAIMEGDTLAYQRSYKQYAINGYSKEFLYYAVIMAEKNNFKGAYDDISRILSFELDDPIYNVHQFSSKFGRYSKLKAYELGDSGAKVDVDYLYVKKGEPIPSSESLYCGK